MLWSVDFDPNSHGSGPNKPVTGHTVFCEGKEIIVNTDTCYSPDNLGHPPGVDDPMEGSPDVFAY